MIAEKTIEQDKQIYNCFIDFQKAFDSVPHQCLWKVLEFYKVPPNIIELLIELYAKAESTTLVNGEETEFFRTTKGCRQGCILSPPLFLFYLEKIINEALENHEGGAKVGNNILNNLKFADDIVLMNTKKEKLQDAINKTNTSSKKYGMKINKKKTETMVFCKEENKNKLKMKLEEETLNNVSNFKYLECKFTYDNECSAEIRNRIALASYAYSKLNKIWKNNRITIKTNLKVLRVCVLKCI